MIRRIAVAIALAVLFASPLRAAETYVVDKSHSEASFQVSHLGISKVRGRFGDFEGTIRLDRAKAEASSVEFVIRAASLDTAHADRDKHLRSADFFDVEKYPTISFRSSKIVPKGQDRYDVTGTLTIRGVSKEVTLPVAFLGFVKDPWGNEKAGFEVSVALNRKDFGLVWNKTLDNGGLVVGEQAFVEISLETVKQKETASN